MTLADLKPGQSGTIQSTGGETALRCRLLDMGLTPGTRVQLQKKAPFGDPIQLRLRGFSLSIRLESARQIELEVQP